MITLRSGARLFQIQKGIGPNWLLVPGGPGISSDYMSSLKPIIGRNASIWRFDFPGCTKTPRTPVGTREIWLAGLVEALKFIDHPIILGHSMGGMLIQELKGVEDLLSGVVLVASSPNRKWRQHSILATQKISNPTADKCERFFTDNPSDRSLKALWLSWIPYYFQKAAYAKARKLFNRTAFNAEAFELGNSEVLPKFRRKWWPHKIPILVMGGTRDLVTPLSLFKSSTLGSKPSLKLAIIRGGGHFPWIEKPKIVARWLQLFSQQCTKS